MTRRAEIMAELERRHPDSAELLAELRHLSRGGRPRVEPLSDEKRDKMIRRLILQALRRHPTFPTRSEIYRVTRNYGSGQDLEIGLAALEMEGKIESDRSAPIRGRPVTTYALKKDDNDD